MKNNMPQRDDRGENRSLARIDGIRVQIEVAALNAHQCEVLTRYFAMLTAEVTPMQAARLAEIWELICEEQGWLLRPETPQD